LCFFTSPLSAGTVTGQIEVKKKGGRHTLDSYEYAVVYLAGIDKPLTSVAAAEPIIINQKNKRFFPRLMPIVTGQTVHFFNQDELEHNVFSTEEKQSFDLGRYPKGDFRPVTYEQSGNYKVYCNIHQKMVLDIVVLDNHYFAVTDEKGDFSIDNVPPGNYKLNVWHIYGGMTEQNITVTDVDMTLPLLSVISTKVVRDVQKHTNKHGKKYKKRGRYRRN
jgi:plastocyanin